jgi:hypothetical protein
MEPPAVAGAVHLEVHQEDLEAISRLTGEFSFDHSPKPMTRVQGKLRSGIRNPLSTLNEPSQECLYRERFIWNGADDIRSMTAGGGPPHCETHFNRVVGEYAQSAKKVKSRRCLTRQLSFSQRGQPTTKNLVPWLSTLVPTQNQNHLDFSFILPYPLPRQPAISNLNRTPISAIYYNLTSCTLPISSHQLYHELCYNAKDIRTVLSEVAFPGSQQRQSARNPSQSSNLVTPSRAHPDDTPLPRPDRHDLPSPHLQRL